MTALDGMTVLVGGGGTPPVVAALVAAGAKVVLQAQTPAERETAQAAAAAHGAIVLERSVMTFADGEELVATVAADHGPLAAVVTAQVPQEADTLADLTQASWVGFKAAYLTRAVALARAAAAQMATQPGGGRIVVLGSATTFSSTGAAQAAVNAGLISLVSAASAGMRDTEVRVNGILLGLPGADQGGIPAPATDGPDVLPATVVWLASAESEGVNGKLVYAGGADVGFYTMPMLMENANVQVRFGEQPSAGDIGGLLNPLAEIGKVQRQA